jgi:transcriptional regulator with XRE-family HTH domain
LKVKVAMPLDTGGIADLQGDGGTGASPAPAEAPAPTLESGADIGQALQAVRLHKGLSLEAVAEITRIRRAYLADLEAMALDKLPSRPFTIGYIRAYAEALGLEAEAAVERFKAEEPVLDEPLRAPTGVSYDRDPRFTIIIVGVLALVAAIVIWNVAQRAMRDSAPPSPTAPEKAAAQALEAQKAGPVALGAPLPAPVESTTPPPYETPGLADAGEDGVNHSAPAAMGARPLDHVPVDPATLPQVFKPAGRIYGAPADQPATVILQARKSVSLILRGADGSVYFARQLAPGEAFRAPLLAGLSVNVSEPDSVQVFVAGQSRGVLPAPDTAVSALAQ